MDKKHQFLSPRIVVVTPAAKIVMEKACENIRDAVKRIDGIFALARAINKDNSARKDEPLRVYVCAYEREVVPYDCVGAVGEYPFAFALKGSLEETISGAHVDHDGSGFLVSIEAGDHQG